MSIMIHEARGDEIEQLIPLLLLAEPSKSALRWSLKNLSDTVYRVDEDEQVVGAVTMRWNGEPCEIVELAVAEDRHGRGIGKQVVAWLITEAKSRGKQRMVVGTGNASIGNIVFYQKCGFRMDHIRRDYFWYYRKPIIKDGIRARDLLVFSYELTEGKTIDGEGV
jgi:GNAT superfamily N-acetyltransferase